MDKTQRCEGCKEWFHYDYGVCPYCGTASSRLVNDSAFCPQPKTRGTQPKKAKRLFRA